MSTVTLKNKDTIGYFILFVSVSIYLYTSTLKASAIKNTITKFFLVLWWMLETKIPGIAQPRSSKKVLKNEALAIIEEESKEGVEGLRTHVEV